MKDPRELAYEVVAALAGTRADLTNEKATQAAIECALAAKALPFRREVRLSPRDIPDFLVFDVVAVEIKIGGARAAIFRQIQRYACHDRVKAIVLASNVPIGLPTQIDGKPCLLASLGAAWL